MTARLRSPGFAELHTPKLVSRLREGYSLDDLRADAISGLTVAVVAVPLSMAIAIASGVTPDRGLYTAIIGGFLVSAFGGSRFQIGGPAGAFIILVASTVQLHGIDGLILATMMSGLILLAIGLLRLGTFIKYIPYPVTVGFTAGIAVVIFSSEIKDLFGLTLIAPEPGPLIPKIQALAAVTNTFNSAAIGVAVVTILLIALVRRFRPHWPAYLIGVTTATLLAWALDFQIATIGTQFGGIPRSFPLPQLPEFSLARVQEMLPAAFSFALLGSIESLLSAVVADSMTGRRHRPNAELVAQGIANIGSALFGGFCVTGTIARTATNVRAGARSPISGLMHSLFLLLFILVAAPLASYVPLAALAAVLAVVCWTMAEKHEFLILLRASWADAVILLTTFLLVIFRDLTTGILVGFGIGALVFLHRMAQMVNVERPEDLSDIPVPTDDPDIAFYRISGAFFFGAAAAVAAALDRIGERPHAYIIDCSNISVIDSTAAATIAGFAARARHRGATVYLTSTNKAVRRALFSHHIRPPLARFKATNAAAVKAAQSARGKKA